MSVAVEPIVEQSAPAPLVDVPSTSAGDELPLTVVEPRPGWQLLNARELWQARELLYFLTWRDIAVRYKQTVLGVAWSVLQPLSTVVVFSLFLGSMSGAAQSVSNYPLFVLAGMVPWTFFANAITQASTSLVSNQNLVSKVYFPRLLIPTAAVVACAADFAIALVMLFVAMLIYGVWPGFSILFAVPIFALLLLAAQGIGVLLGALTVAHRDVRFVMNFAVQLWMFATPTIYLSSASIGPTAQRWLPLNPVYGLILNFRAAMLGGEGDWYALAVSSAVSLALLAAGLAYFRRVESNFADVI